MPATATAKWVPLQCAILLVAGLASRAFQLPATGDLRQAGQLAGPWRASGAPFQPFAGAPEDSISFPGKPSEATFGAFGGYINVDEEAGRELYYVLVEAESHPETAPVVLWLNGGPGCSSLGGGLMSELGPYYPNKDGGLKLNTHRWNAVAHMLFLESPAFVGFSYSNTTLDRTVGDERTAADSLAFLIAFFKKYPALAKNEFYISGESYGGHYVPTLALAIFKHNQACKGDCINLQGFLVGNAWTDAAIDNEGALDFWWSHAIISDTARDAVKRYCNFSSVGPLSDTAPCDAAVLLAMTGMGPINIYDIYVDVCFPSAASGSPAALAAALRDHPAGMSTRLAAVGQDSSTYDPCIDNEVAVYLNRPDVQAAMHANTTGLIPGPWADCTELVDYSRKDLLTSMLPVYKELLKTGMRMLVFSGDVDAIVPVIGTRRWIAKLEMDVQKAWRPWFVGQQVSGYVEVYDGLTLATVRDAGHMVPYTQPARAFHLFESFVFDVEL